jgi:hypothetical protein
MYVISCTIRPALPVHVDILYCSFKGIRSDCMKLLLRKINSLDEKMDITLKKVNIILNRSGGGDASSSTGDTGSCLPAGISLPIDSYRTLAEVDHRIAHEVVTKKQLV